MFIIENLRAYEDSLVDSTLDFRGIEWIQNDKREDKQVLTLIPYSGCLEDFLLYLKLLNRSYEKWKVQAKDNKLEISIYY